MNESNLSFLVDGVGAMGVHNDVVRIEFAQIQPNGRADSVLQLHIPIKQVSKIIEALRNAVR